MPIDQPPPAYGFVNCYQRYGGMCQMSPLTADEQKYDDTCRKIDAMEAKIGQKSMALFTAAEYGWFSWFVNKMFVAPNQDQLDSQLAQLNALMATLEEREKGAK